jgi:hypothetical protein
MPPISSHSQSSEGGLYIESFFLFTGTLIFHEKFRQSAALFSFGLRVVGILHIFYLLDVLSSYSLAHLYLMNNSAKVLGDILVWIADSWNSSYILLS